MPDDQDQSAKLGALISRKIDYAASPTLSTIRDLAGETAVLALVTAKGGGVLYIPEKASPRCRLASIVGLEAAKKIAEHFGKCALDIPTGAGLAHARRIDYSEVIRLAKAGKKTPQIARQVGCSARQVRNILRKERGREEDRLLRAAREAKRSNRQGGHLIRT